MAKPSIDTFLSEAIANHDWLDPSGKQKVNYPGSDHLTYDKRQDLADMYTMPEVYPEYDVPPPASIDPNKGKVAVVVKEVKRQMMAGKTLAHIKETILDTMPADLKSAAKEEILKAAAEYPFLGSVYIDTAVFEGNNIKACEKGAEFVKSASKLAIYAKKNASCGGCSKNQGGFCRVYKKALVNEVPYTENTFNHYKDHLLLANKIEMTSKISSKQDLGNALLGKSSAPVREATSVVYHNESKLSKFAEQVATAIDSKEMRDISRDLSLKLSSGMSPEHFKQYVTEKYSSTYKKYPEVFQKYADYVGSLGNVFLEAGIFKSVTELQQFVNRYPKAKYIVSKNANVTELTTGRKVVSSIAEIPLAAWQKNLQGVSYKIEDLKANPLLVTKNASLKPMQKQAAQVDANPVELANEVEMNGYNPDKVATKSVTHEEVKQQLSQGKPIKEIMSKTGSHAVKPAIEKYLKTASVVQTTLFDAPCNPGFEINKIAKLAPKKACHSCSYNKGMVCSKLDRSFVSYTSKSASAPAETTVKQDGAKTTNKISKNLSVELEPTDFDESVKKYL